MANSRFCYVIYIRTTPEKLWQALIDPASTRQYWFATWQDCQWKQGDLWRLMAPDDRVADAGEVLEVEPQKWLVLSWRHELMPELRAEGFSRMTYALEQQNETVKLTLAHEMEQPNSKFIDDVATGWPIILSSLKSLLETGDSLEATRKWPEGM